MQSTLVADYTTPEAFIEAVDLEVSNGGLLVRGAKVEGRHPDCKIIIRVVGETIAEVQGQVAVIGRMGVAVEFEEVPFELVALADRYRAQSQPPSTPPIVPPAPAEPPAVKASGLHEPIKQEPKGTVAERLAALNVSQKMQLALAGDRDVRIPLMRDPNKAIHVFVLRNPRIELDEVLFAAKNAQLSPDALKFISEHVEWSKNTQVCIALVRNVKTPMPIALKLLPRLPGTEIRAIAKGGARDQLVGAAKKLLAG